MRTELSFVLLAWVSLFASVGHAELLSPGELRRLSAASPPAGTDPVVVLREERDVRVDGRVWVRTNRLVYRIDDAAAISAWGHLALEYSPWAEERPRVAVRLTTPDGAVFDLDPATLTESSVGRDDDVYTDRRRLAAPLPGVQRGSIIERIIVYKSRADSAFPFERARFEFGGPRTIASRLRIDAPAGSVVRSAGIGAPNPKVEKRAGRQVWTWERGELAAHKPDEPWPEPSAVVPDGLVVASVDTTWADVATAYHRIVEEALRGFDGAAALGRELAIERTALMKESRDTRIQRILDAVGERIRYTGLSLGDAAVVPRPPAVTLERRFGDCKDLATLVTGLLRAVDIDARVALVSTSLLPVLDAPGAAFDHAIVVVPGKAGASDLWIDATVRGLKVGEIGGGIERRRSLIAAPETRSLSTVPPTHGTYREDREIRLTARGPATVVERSKSSGAIAIASRWGFTDEERARRREQLEKWARDAWSVDASDPVAVEIDSDLTGVTVRAHGKIGLSEPTSAEAWVRSDSLFDWLPQPLRETPGDDKQATAARRTPLEGTMTIDSRLVAHIIPPAGFEALPLPAGRNWKVGPISLAESSRMLPDGSVEAVVQLRQDALRLEARDVDEARQRIASFLHDDPAPFRFVTRARALRERGDHRGALRLALADAAASPRDSLTQVRLGEELLAAGVIEGARAAARRATTLGPGDVDAWRLLARSSEQNLLGVNLGFGADLVGARAAHRKVVELNGNDDAARVAAATALLHEPGGALVGDPAAGKEALSVLSEIPQKRRTDEAFGLISQAAAIGNALPRLGELLGSTTDYDEVRDAFFARGVDAGVAAAKAQLSAADREQLLDFVSNTFLAARRYAEVEALLAHRGRPSALGSVAPHCDPMPPSAKAPVRSSGPEVVRGALLELVHPLATVEKVRQRWSGSPASQPSTMLTLDHERAAVLPSLANPSLPSLFTCDLLSRSLAPMIALDHAEGQVLRLNLRTADAAIQANYVVTRERDGLRLFETSPRSLAQLGDAALDALARKNRKRAEFFVEAAGMLGIKPKLTPPAGATLETRAAYLALEGPGARAAWALLGPAERPPALQQAMLSMLDAGDAGPAGMLFDEYAKTADNRALVALVAVDLERLDVAEKEVALLPVNPLTRRLRVRIAFARGRAEEGTRIEDELLADPSFVDKALRATILNDRAWRAVAGGDPAALDLARRALQLEARPGIEHTLASAAAAAARPRETLEALRRMVGTNDRLDGNALYALARLAEEVGAREDAGRLYQEAARLLPASASVEGSSRRLIDQGLARLKLRAPSH